MNRFLKRHGIWLFYAVFLIIAVATSDTTQHIGYHGPLAGGIWAVAVIFVLFLAYSVYCSVKELFFRSVAKINRFHWGRQIGIDLYISVTLSLAVIWLNDGALTMLVWLVPVVIFANLAILPYILLNYGSLIAHFTV